MESKIGRPAIANKYRLTIFFGIAAMVIIFGATFVMSHILGRIAENNLVRLAENSITSDAVQILSAIRRTELPQGMVSSGPVSGASSPNKSAINREWLKGSKELSKTLPTLVEKYSIVSLSLYDPDGQSVWSTDPTANRGIDQANPIFSVALAGSISSSFLQDKEVSDFGGARQSISVVQTYLPVRTVSSSDVSGVLEIERNVTADVPFLIDATKSSTLKVTGVSMGGLFLILIFVVVVADGTVSRSRKREGWTEIRLAEKEQSEAALKESNYRLEEAL